MISSTKASTASALPLCLHTTQCQAQGLVYSSGSIILFWIDKRRLCLRHFKKIMASSRDVTSLKEDLLAWKWNVTIWNILEGLDLFNIPNKGCQCQLNFTCLTEAYVFTGSLILPLIDHKMVANQIPIMVHCQSNFSALHQNTYSKMLLSGNQRSVIVSHTCTASGYFSVFSPANARPTDRQEPTNPQTSDKRSHLFYFSCPSTHYSSTCPQGILQ